MPKQSRLDDDAFIYQPHKKQTEKEKLGEMPLKDKFSYLWEYYKVHALAILAVIGIIIYIIYRILNPAIEPAFYAAFVNNSIDQTVLEQYNADFTKRLQLDPKRENVVFNTTFTFGNDDPYAANIQTAFAAHIAANEIDVIIAPESDFKNFVSAGYFNQLSDQLPTDIYSSLTDQFYMAKTEEDKEDNVYGIYLANTKLYKNNSGNADPYILGIVAGSKHEENTIEFIRYLFNDK